MGGFEVRVACFLRGFEVFFFFTCSFFSFLSSTLSLSLSSALSWRLGGRHACRCAVCVWKVANAKGMGRKGKTREGKGRYPNAYTTHV